MLSGMETKAKIAVGTRRKSEQSFQGRRVHLIGIGGCGMRALARTLLERGALISGSDAAGSAAVERLAAEGAKVAVGQQAENIPHDCEMVVYSAAIVEGNVELAAARGRGLEVMKYSQMLGRLMAERVGIAVAGTHGKSTTTAMVAYALSHAGFDPSYIVGATVEQLGGPSGVGMGQHFVAEACEYDRSFLNLQPVYAAILNIEEDHLDCYRDLEAIVQAFRAFAGGIDPGGVLVANGEDARVVEAISGAACQVQTFGFEEHFTWRGVNLTADLGRCRFDVTAEGRVVCRVALRLPGRHNAYNALAAAALLHQAGLSGEQIADGLGGFTGTYRRMTYKGCNRGVTVMDDYAHHPTEIRATLAAIREYHQPRRVVCVFQPHQHSRTRFLLKDFARSFEGAEEVIVPDIYFVRDSELEKNYISSRDLVDQLRLNGRTAVYLKSFDEINAHLQETLREGDLVVTMGAGNVWEIADQTVRWLGRDRTG